MAKALSVGPGQQSDASGLMPASVRDDWRPTNPKSTPETKARKVLMLERVRQQTRIRQMEAVRVEMTILENILRELLSDQAFVALLRCQGFATVPRLIRERLTGQQT
ncbi:hypothetical protein P0D75_11505 [Paraburkholderia sediminicola]|jgi:hypothetical protein|uniref:hypothetical protein n=1 Tax=Paraburkholderia sediminicola TaxID=458836 RepID=UPI0038B7804D